MTEDEKKVSEIENFIKKVIGSSIELKQDEIHKLKELALCILCYLAPQFSCTQVFSYEVHNDKISPEMLILDDKLFVPIESLLKAFRDKYDKLRLSFPEVGNMHKFNGIFSNANNDDIIKNPKKVISVKRVNIPVNSVLDIENIKIGDLNKLIENDKTANEKPGFRYACATNGRSLTIHDYIMDIIIENVKNGKINKVTEFFKDLKDSDVQNEDFKNDCIWYIKNVVCKDFIIEDESVERLANVLSNKKLYEKSDFVEYILAKTVLKTIDQLSKKITENVLNDIKKYLKTDKEFQDILSRNPEILKKFFSSLTQNDIREILDFLFAYEFITLPATRLFRLLDYIALYELSEKQEAIE